MSRFLGWSIIGLAVVVSVASLSIPEKKVPSGPSIVRVAADKDLYVLLDESVLRLGADGTFKDAFTVTELSRFESVEDLLLEGEDLVLLTSDRDILRISTRTRLQEGARKRNSELTTLHNYPRFTLSGEVPEDRSRSCTIEAVSPGGADQIFAVEHCDISEWNVAIMSSKEKTIARRRLALFERPAGIAYRGPDLVVSDRETMRLSRVSLAGERLGVFGDAEVIRRFDEVKARHTKIDRIQQVRVTLPVVGIFIALFAALFLARRTHMSAVRGIGERVAPGAFPPKPKTNRLLRFALVALLCLAGVGAVAMVFGVMIGEVVGLLAFIPLAALTVAKAVQRTARVTAERFVSEHAATIERALSPKEVIRYSGSAALAPGKLRGVPFAHVLITDRRVLVFENSMIPWGAPQLLESIPLEDIADVERRASKPWLEKLVGRRFVQVKRHKESTPLELSLSDEEASHAFAEKIREGAGRLSLADDGAEQGALSAPASGTDGAVSKVDR